MTCKCGLSRKPEYPKGHYDIWICKKHEKELEDLKKKLGIEEELEIPFKESDNTK